MTPERIGEVTVPVAYVGAGLGASGAVACAPEDENFRQYYDNGGSPAWLYTFPNAGHSDFTDPCAEAPGPITCRTCEFGDDPAAYRAINRALATSFFRLQLLGDEDFRPWVDSPEDFVTGVTIEVETK